MLPSRRVRDVADGNRIQRHARLSSFILAHDFPREVAGATVHPHLWGRGVREFGPDVGERPSPSP